MSWWPFRKKSEGLSVTFLSSIPHLQDVYPIYPAKDLALPWVPESQQAVAPRQADYTKGRMHGATHKCSGIMSFVSKGWILPAWHDFVIATNGDGTSKQVHLPSNAARVGLGTSPIGAFKAEYYGDLPSNALPPRTLKQVIKVHTPWVFDITPGWGLMMLPLEYIKEHRFTSTIGIVNPRISAQLNAVLYWHVLNGSTLIKAGTPLCRLVPIPVEDRWTYTTREMTPDESKYHRARQFFLDGKWSTAHGMLSRLYERVIKKNRR